MWWSVTSARPRRLRADSTNAAVIAAVITLMKPSPVSMTRTATSLPSVFVGTLSP